MVHPQLFAGCGSFCGRSRRGKRRQKRKKQERRKRKRKILKSTAAGNSGTWVQGLQNIE